MVNILITGGLGFVGINLVRYLAQNISGSHILIGDILEPTPQTDAFLVPVARQVRNVRLDVTDRVSVNSLVQGEGVTHIVHAAAITPTFEREQAQPTTIVDVNLGGAINVLDAALHCPSVERVLLLSSSGVYGNPRDTSTAALPEEGPLQLNNLYSITKYSAELLGARYGQLSGRTIASARLAAPYGPLERPTGSRERMGQLQQLITALRQDRMVRVAGPNVRRDWTFVDDTAEAIRALLFAPQLNYSVYNVSCGQGYTFRQVVDAFIAHGLRAEWIEDAADADVAMQPHQERAPLDLGRLQADTGFTPGFDLTQGVAAYVKLSSGC